MKSKPNVSVRAALVVSATAALCACAAPRDPELEKQVILARQAPKQVDEADDGGPPQIATVPTRPTRTFSGEEIARILAAVPGTGDKLVATITTAQGAITCTLDERAPQTVANFVGLATGQLEWKPLPDDPPRTTAFYDGLSFHRVVNEFIIQTGNPTGKAGAGPGWRLGREQGATDLFQQAGAMGMIDDGDAMHGSQFFITAKPDRGLANTYNAFGRCAEVDLVKAISKADKKPNDPKAPMDPVSIRSITVERRP